MTHLPLKRLAAIGLGFAALGCQAPAAHTASQSDLGRYHFSQDSSAVYIADSATGEVWLYSLRHTDAHWVSLGSPAATTKPTSP